MKKEIIIAGFGGQGVLALGQMLVYGGMSEGKEVSWFPSYGPEMRGGTANCSIVIADKEISSPVVTKPDILIAFNKPSLEKFLPQVKSEGIVIYNKSLIPSFKMRNELTYYGIAANSIAEKAGNVKAANVVLGEALLVLTDIISSDAYTYGIQKLLPNKPAILEMNMQARNSVRLLYSSTHGKLMTG